MSRTRPRQQRLNLFKRGNTRCPICLSSFTKKDVIAGESVTLEHVPPSAFKREFGINSMPLCLTCADCNNMAGRQADQAAVKALQELKAHIKIRGVSHAGTFSLQGGDVPHIQIRSKPRVSPVDYRNLQAEDLKFSVKVPNPRYVDASWLKSAYLSVFALLGRMGYRYAEGEAICRVREQIMNPDKEIIGRVPYGNVAEYGGDWIQMHRESPGPCWIVNFGPSAVLLPASWNTSLYDDPNLFREGGQFKLATSYFFDRFKFGDYPVASVSYDDQESLSAVLGENPFGVSASVNGVTKHFVVADFRGRLVSLLTVKAPDSDSSV